MPTEAVYFIKNTTDALFGLPLASVWLSLAPRWPPRAPQGEQYSLLAQVEWRQIREIPATRWLKNRALVREWCTFWIMTPLQVVLQRLPVLFVGQYTHIRCQWEANEWPREAKGRPMDANGMPRSPVRGGARPVGSRK